MSVTVINTHAIPAALNIAKTVVAIPAFHEAGHSVEELPTMAPLDAERHTLPFDVRQYPDVLAAARRTHAKDPRHSGIWTTDLIAYEREHTVDVWTWLLKRAGSWSESARRAAFWREAKPLGIVERVIAQNILTDYGATTLLKVINNAAQAQFFNHLQLSADAKVAQVSGVTANLSSGIAAGVTAIPVTSGGTSFTNGMTIVIGAGTANAETRIVTTGATGTSIPITVATSNTHATNDLVAQGVATGATAIPVVSGGAAFTNTMTATASYGATTYSESLNIGSGSTATSIVTAATTKVHAANDWIVQNPGTQANSAVDNPSAVTSGYDSGVLAAGAFTFSGTGPGNRQVQVAYNFPSNASAPSPGYTDLWVASATPIAANTTAAHLTRSPLAVNATTGANVTYSDSF